jgi:hypothetical protein
VSPDAPRQTFVVRLRPLPNVDGVKALRRALKYALRVCRLRALSATEERDTKNVSENSRNERE